MRLLSGGFLHIFDPFRPRWVRRSGLLRQLPWSIICLWSVKSDWPAVTRKDGVRRSERQAWLLLCIHEPPKSSLHRGPNAIDCASMFMIIPAESFSFHLFFRWAALVPENTLVPLRYRRARVLVGWGRWVVGCARDSGKARFSYSRHRYSRYRYSRLSYFKYGPRNRVMDCWARKFGVGNNSSQLLGF